MLGINEFNHVLNMAAEWTEISTVCTWILLICDLDFRVPEHITTMLTKVWYKGRDSDGTLA